MSHVDHVYCSCKFNSRVKIHFKIQTTKHISIQNFNQNINLEVIRKICFKTTSCVSNSIFKSKIKSISPHNNPFQVENLIPDLKRKFESI